MRFLLLRFDLREKNHFSPSVDLSRSEKLCNLFLRTWTSDTVSFVSILGPEPRKIHLRKLSLDSNRNFSGKNVNKGPIEVIVNLSRKPEESCPSRDPSHLRGNLKLPCLSWYCSQRSVNWPSNLVRTTSKRGDRLDRPEHSCTLNLLKSTKIRMPKVLNLSSWPSSLSSLLCLSLYYPLYYPLVYSFTNSPKNSRENNLTLTLIRSIRSKNSKEKPLDSSSQDKRSTSLKRITSLRCPTFSALSPSRANETREAEEKDGRHRRLIIKLKQVRSHDIEEHPGPATSGTGAPMAEIKVISYNVRGLNDELKLRHLINFCYKLNKNLEKDNVVCLQETYVENPGKIPYLWRGNFHLTPGLGNSQGCITLLNHNLNILHAQNLGNRGHVLVCQKLGQPKASLIICNIYAPNVNNREKISFFEEIVNLIEDYEARFDCEKVIIAGDFNLIFKTREGKNRNNPAQERNVARTVENQLKNLNLVDIWEEKSSFTWNRPNSDSFSTIDHIFYSKENFTLLKTDTDWSVSLSDHAMVIVTMGIVSTLAPKKSHMIRLDPSTLDLENKERLTDEINDLLRQIPNHWNPHQKLEFAKVCTRTVLEREQVQRRTRERSEEELLNSELDTAIKALERGGHSGARRLDLIDYVEELRVRKEILIENKGKRLAEKLGTQWYNEGEKSNKYFLNILKRKSPTNFEELVGEGGVKVVSEGEIEEEVVNFYRNLYENYPRQTNLDDNHFFDEIPGVSVETDQLISEPLTVEELGAVLDTCKESSPGPDGIPYSILKNLWRIFGPLLVDAWNFSLLTGNLPPSHKTSYLRLIPKVGKDKTKLTNWRPITLSNCDHKVISKAYAKRISEKLADHILERQTAYLKGRLINDNIRTLLGAIKLSNNETDINGMIVSLDAKKAFDSVEHSYIEKTLKRFGLEKFIPIFKTLYADLQSDIIINGKIVKGFRIKRGVKQGDALSCILFIMCIEPLLRNIEKNPLIKEIVSTNLGALPKALSYADDVNCIVKNDPITLREIFKEYERLTKASGLELNAEKTEILPFVSENLNLNKREMRFQFQYNQTNYDLLAVQVTKINGIEIQQDERAMKDSNLDVALQRTENHLKTWSARNLSVLGKILIVKTFGISQLIFLLQSFVLDENHFKKINHVLYKFIWNRHFAAAKAPERIKRELVNKSIKLGGLGMLDVKELDASLKLRAIGRLLTSNHPFLSAVKNKLNLTDFFNPELRTNLDEIANHGTNLLKSNRKGYLTSEVLGNSTKFIKAIKQIKVRTLLRNNGHLSMAWHSLHTRGVRTVGSLNLAELRTIERFIDPNIINNLRAATRVPNNLIQDPEIGSSIIKRNKFVPLTALSSKDLRMMISDNTPVTIFKFGPIMNPGTSINWASSLAKVTSTKHKDLLLRLVHGELYSKERLHRYRLIDNAQCPRCGEIETLKHKYLECPYIKEIWRRTLLLTDKLRHSIEPTETQEEKILCCTREPNKLALTLHAEIISRIRQLKDNEANLLLLPKLFVKKSAEWILRREKNALIKTEMAELLENY